jgi:hypothetical protein
MSLAGTLDNVGLFVGRFMKSASSAVPEGETRDEKTCDLPDCGQRATRVFDSVRVDGGPLHVCTRHTSDVRRWVG